MRHPVKTLPKHIDPWAFCKHRETLQGELNAMQTKQLQQWLAKEDTIEFSLEGNIDSRRQPRLSGQIDATLHLQCQRCLEPMRYPLKTNFDYVLIAHERLEEKVLDGSETLICDQEEIELSWFIEEELLLSMPMIAKHENCNLPLEDVVVQTPIRDERIENTQQPFADLKKLLNSKE